MSTTGHGCTVSFGTTNLVLTVQSISGLSLELPSVNESHLGSATYEQYCPGDLFDHQPIEATVIWDDDNVDVDAGDGIQDAVIDTVSRRTSEQITLTWQQTVPGNTTAPTMVANGFLIGYDSPTRSNNELNVGTVRWRYDGSGFTWTESAP